MNNPFKLEFEELLPYFRVEDGECTLYEGPAPAPFPANPADPTEHIRTDQTWGVAVKWTTRGALNYLMCGNWEIIVYLEQMGGGEFYLQNNTSGPIPFVSGQHDYTHVFNFPPGSVPEEGAYRVVVKVDMTGPTGFQGPISGVGEGPLATFYAVG